MSGFGLTGVTHQSSEQTLLQRMHALVRLREAPKHVTKLFGIILSK